MTSRARPCVLRSYLGVVRNVLTVTRLNGAGPLKPCSGAWVMDASVLMICSSAAAVGSGLWIYLDRRGDRELAKYVFDHTRSTDALNGYIELRKAQPPVIGVGRKASDDTATSPPEVSEGQGAPP
jgi:hypothetical protein